jgi:hypothetical protein
MAAQERSVTDLTVANSAATTDKVVAVVANSSGSNVTMLLPVGYTPTSNTPANSTSTTVTKGASWNDGNYIYVATSNNVVKRAALSSF